MKIHCLQHVAFEGPSSIAAWAESRGHSLATTRLYAGDGLPDVGGFDMLVIMGGPMSVHDAGEYAWMDGEKKFIRAAIDAGKVVFGICLGAQMIAEALGGEVFPGAQKEIGWFEVEKCEGARGAVADALPEKFEAFHWHGETFSLPQGAVRLASSTVCENQAFVCVERVAAFQFHLEATPDGVRRLVDNCGDELIDGEYIQPAAEMLAAPERFEKINRLMDAVLHGLTGG